MTQPDFSAASKFAIYEMENHLPPGITYHSSAHTLNEVTPAVDRMILAENITDALDQLLLRTAALFHDLGYITAHLNHEVVSARIAAEELPGFGYSQPQVETVQAMIMATQLPQSPHGLLQEILADADLDILGSPNFFARNMDLRNEMDFLLQPVDDVIWYTNQIAFLRKHKYFTRSTRELRLPGKQRNLQELTWLLENARKAQLPPVPSRNSRATH
jgi:uncharacterized protein